MEKKLKEREVIVVVGKARRVARNEQWRVSRQSGCKIVDMSDIRVIVIAARLSAFMRAGSCIG